MATFMAKWSKHWPGQSGHLHMSMTRKDGSAVFHDETSRTPCRTNALVRRRPAGIDAGTAGDGGLDGEQLLAAGTRILGADGSTWGVENRTCALRVIPGGAKSQRVEYRIAAADINPYLAIAVAIGSGLWGIETSIEPGEPIVGNAYEREASGQTRSCRAR